MSGIEDAEIERLEREHAENRRLVSEEAASPFGRHRWVRLKDLQNTALNGKFAEVIRRPQDGSGGEDERFAVRVEGTEKPVRIKGMNLEAIPDAETIKVCHISARGEEPFDGGHVQTVRWPRAILESPAYHSDASPISRRLGFPLRITRVLPRSKLTGRADFDNQLVTYMMLELRSGFAPMSWQSYVGPAVVWRESGAPFSSDDMILLDQFISDLLERYSEQEVSPRRDITPSAWAKFRDRSGMMDDSDAWNINL